MENNIKLKTILISEGRKIVTLIRIESKNLPPFSTVICLKIFLRGLSHLDYLVFVGRSG